MYSIAQQAVPKGRGQREFFRAQATRLSSRVVKKSAEPDGIPSIGRAGGPAAAGFFARSNAIGRIYQPFAEADKNRALFADAGIFGAAAGQCRRGDSITEPVCELPRKNAPNEEIRRILTEAKTIAVVGLS